MVFITSRIGVSLFPGSKLCLNGSVNCVFCQSLLRMCLVVHEVRKPMTLMILLLLVRCFTNNISYYKFSDEWMQYFGSGIHAGPGNTLLTQKKVCLYLPSVGVKGVRVSIQLKTDAS